MKRFQNKVNANLLYRFRQLWAGIAVLVFLALLAFYYFAMLPSITGEALQIEHRRLQLVLASIRAQWQSYGEPKVMDLDWINITNTDTDTHNSLVKMAKGGWPLPNHRTKQGCEQLWYQLLGVKLDSWEITATYLPSLDSCQFTAVNLTSVIFELRSGNVKYLTQ